MVEFCRGVVQLLLLFTADIPVELVPVALILKL